MRVESLPWQYIRPLGAIGDLVSIEDEEWHHCRQVLRLREGNHLILTDGMGRAVQGLIRLADQRRGQIELIDDVSLKFDHSRHYSVTIAFAPTKNIDRTEFAVEKITELGVNEICFLKCKHGERDKIRMDRMEKIVASAAKQSRKSTFPHLQDMTLPLSFIQSKKTSVPGIEILACHLDENSRGLPQNYTAGKDVVLLVGPEGGFADEEILGMNELNVSFVHLGPFRLRVETAVFKACASIHLINEMQIKI